MGQSAAFSGLHVTQNCRECTRGSCCPPGGCQRVGGVGWQKPRGVHQGGKGRVLQFEGNSSMRWKILGESELHMSQQCVLVAWGAVGGVLSADGEL